MNQIKLKPLSINKEKEGEKSESKEKQGQRQTQPVRMPLVSVLRIGKILI